MINMDMIAWDGDEDMAVEIHSSYQANSDQLASYIVEVDALYDLQVVPAIQIPGTTASDHSRFWNNGYAAVLIIEEYYGGDFNPYYHSEEDRIGILNMPYFHEMAKLSIGSLASMAQPVEETSVAYSLENKGIFLGNQPNPFRTQTAITFAVKQDSHVRLTLFNSQGREMGILVEGLVKAGEHQVQFRPGDLPRGLYFIRLQSAGQAITHKIVLQ